MYEVLLLEVPSECRLFIVLPRLIPEATLGDWTALKNVCPFLLLEMTPQTGHTPHRIAVRGRHKGKSLMLLLLLYRGYREVESLWSGGDCCVTDMTQQPGHTKAGIVCFSWAC